MDGDVTARATAATATATAPRRRVGPLDLDGEVAAGVGEHQHGAFGGQVFDGEIDDAAEDVVERAVEHQRFGGFGQEVDQAVRIARADAGRGRFLRVDAPEQRAGLFEQGDVERAAAAGIGEWRGGAGPVSAAEAPSP